MDTDTNRKAPPRGRRAQSLKLWLLSAALLALAGFLKVEAGSHGERHGIATAEARSSGNPEPSAARGEADAVVLPEEYHAIRPAGVEGAAPAIPPSETWPAQ
jgi:hypothetical protein